MTKETKELKTKLEALEAKILRLEAGELSSNIALSYLGLGFGFFYALFMPDANGHYQTKRWRTGVQEGPISLPPWVQPPPPLPIEDTDETLA